MFAQKFCSCHIFVLHVFKAEVGAKFESFSKWSHESFQGGVRCIPFSGPFSPLSFSRSVHKYVTLYFHRFLHCFCATLIVLVASFAVVEVSSRLLLLGLSAHRTTSQILLAFFVFIFHIFHKSVERDRQPLIKTIRVVWRYNLNTRAVIHFLYPFVHSFSLCAHHVWQLFFRNTLLSSERDLNTVFERNNQPRHHHEKFSTTHLFHFYYLPFLILNHPPLLQSEIKKN